MIPFKEVYFYAKVIAEFGSAAAVIIGGLSWLWSTFNQVKKTNDSVTLLMSNHLPHIQSSLDSHGEALGSLSSDIKEVGVKVDGMETRLEDTKAGVKVLGESFLRHLENASKEAPRKRTRRS